MKFPLWWVSHLTKCFRTEHTDDPLPVSGTSKLNQRISQSVDLKIWPCPDFSDKDLMSESTGDYDGFKGAILASVFLYIHLHYCMLANVKVQLLWGVIEANFPEVKSIPGWWLPEHFRGILHLVNHRAQVPFTQIPLAPLWTATCCCSHPSATATMQFKKTPTRTGPHAETWLNRTQRRHTARWWSPSAAVWTFLSKPLRSPFNNAVSFLSHQRHGVPVLGGGGCFF